MSPFETFKYYKTLKLHFSTESYDFFAYKGKTRSINKEKFETSKDRFWAQKIAKTYDKKAPSFFVANFSENPKYYIRDLATDSQCDRVYKQWSSVRKAQLYNLKSDLNNMSDDLDEELNLLFKRYIRKEISKETACIILKQVGCIEQINEENKGDIIWNEYYLAFKKYIPFVNLKKEYEQILLDKFGKIGYK